MVRATKYGVLADMEELERLLSNTLKEYTILRDTLHEVRASNDQRAERNGRLRDRLENMKSQVQGQMNELFANMIGVTLIFFFSVGQISFSAGTIFSSTSES